MVVGGVVVVGVGAGIVGVVVTFEVVVVVEVVVLSGDPQAKLNAKEVITTPPITKLASFRNWRLVTGCTSFFLVTFFVIFTGILLPPNSNEFNCSN